MSPVPIPRSLRLFLIILVVVGSLTVWLVYPSNNAPPPDALYSDHYQAGGIDSEHWRDPVIPPFEEEGRRWDDEVLVDSHGTSLGGSSTPVVDIQHSSPVEELSESVLGGGVIMPKLENATAKAELGRAAWRVLHLMTLRYPDEPTPDDRNALKSYFHLFARLYPCGECAAEFQALLKEYPPQTSSRKSASLWLCHVHNLINARLGKPEFDCLTLDATYDCGCGDEVAGAAPSEPAPAVGLHNDVEDGPVGPVAESAREGVYRLSEDEMDDP